MGNKPTSTKAKKKKAEQVPDALPYLPMEVWEIVLSFCPPKMLIYEVPLVSKICKSIANNLWKIKTRRDYPDVKDEPFDNDSWKELYLGPHKLFPLMGFIITKATFKELTKIKGAIASFSESDLSFSRCAIDDYIFHCNAGIFTKIELVYGLDNAIPEDWQRQGLNWMKSVNDYIALFKRSTGNYYVEDPPAYDKRKCRLCSVIKQRIQNETIYYEIVLVFDKVRSERGPEYFRDAPFTLESIVVQSYLSGRNNDQLIERFNTRLRSG